MVSGEAEVSSVADGPLGDGGELAAGTGLTEAPGLGDPVGTDVAGFDV